MKHNAPLFRHLDRKLAPTMEVDDLVQNITSTRNAALRGVRPAGPKSLASLLAVVAANAADRTVGGERPTSQPSQAAA